MCPCCTDRQQDIAAAQLARDYERDMEDAREEPWKHLWPDYDEPESQRDNFPTWQEEESCRRAFPQFFTDDVSPNP